MSNKNLQGGNVYVKNIKVEKLKLTVVLLLIIVSCLAIWYFVFSIYSFVNFMNKENRKLEYLVNLGITTKDYSDKKIIDIVEDYIKVLKKKELFHKKFLSYQSAYDNLLVNFYLPSLNIWKDPYSWKIDITLIWKKFIESNPFIDTNLISRWTKFFVDLWSNFRWNEVKSLKIWDIKEDKKKSIFRIPISVEVFCPNRANFLALIWKISMTSNKRNISLINEFFYYLFQWIKENHPNLTDKQIWEDIYRWVKFGEREKYIDKDVIEFVIKRSAFCNSLDRRCYFNFKQKYINIPVLAYKLGDRNSSWKTKKKFIRDFLNYYLPPLIDLKSFSFNRVQSVNYENVEINKWFIVKIDFDIIGRSISNEEIAEIKKVLWKACFGKDRNILLDENIAKNVINKKISSLSSTSRISTEQIFNYKEMLSYIEKISKNRKSYSNYQYAIKLFEIYRILNENWLCKQ